MIGYGKKFETGVGMSLLSQRGIRYSVLRDRVSAQLKSIVRSP